MDTMNQYKIERLERSKHRVININLHCLNVSGAKR